MRKKLLFLGHILAFNLIKPLPCASPYFKDHFRLSAQNLADDDSHYTRIVKSGKEQFGWAGVLLANIALMFFCLPLCFSADLLIHAARLLAIKMGTNMLLVVVLLEKFDMLRFQDRRSFLKLLYLCSCLLSSSYWALTCVFLAAFENIGI